VSLGKCFKPFFQEFSGLRLLGPRKGNKRSSSGAPLGGASLFSHSSERAGEGLVLSGLDAGLFLLVISLKQLYPDLETVHPMDFH